MVLLGHIHESAAVVWVSLMEAACSQKLQITKFGGLDGLTMSCVHDMAPAANDELHPASPVLSSHFISGAPENPQPIHQRAVSSPHYLRQA